VPSFRSVDCDLDLRGTAVPARVVIFRGPHSYTREDLVEIFLPGSPPLAAALLSAFLEAGDLRLAGPGEFTFRAFQSGRIDLSQAEAVAQLIGATSEAEGRAAERQLRGELRFRVEAIEGKILSALSLSEAALDFPDEDLTVIEPGEILAPIDSALLQIQSLRGASALRLPDSGATRVALAGFPNAGKSSLLNRLLKKSAAIVMEIRGTTRDPVRGRTAAPGGRQIEWIDLAGFEVPPPSGTPAGESVEEGEDLQGAIARLTRAELETADTIVWLMDGADPDSSDRSLAVFRDLPVRRKILAINKADLLGEEGIAAWRGIPDEPEVVSALTGMGLAGLMARVLEGGGAPEPPLFFVTVRQEAAIDGARKALVRGRDALARGDGYELVSVDLREALGSLREITGREVGEKVLDEIFSRFCIGK